MCICKLNEKLKAKIKISFFLFVITLIPLTSASDTQSAQDNAFPLWNCKPPCALGDKPEDSPTLTPYLPEIKKAKNPAVIICPGGGYSEVMVDHEGKQIAQRLNEIGITAFVLKYRLPANGYRHPVPLMDAQRAIKLVRFNADKWNIDPNKIGIVGFSAGGHLASTAGTHFENQIKADDYIFDEIDKLSCRPDFMILIYPVISMQDSITHHDSKQWLLGKDPNSAIVQLLSNETQVTPQTPPAFIVHCDDDDCVLPENSIYFYNALRKAHVPAEIHIFSKGGHGFGIRPQAGPAAQWPVLCESWMRQLQILQTEENGG